MSTFDHDVIVVGAGAAGLFAAIASSEAGARTLIVDGQARPARKILISGGGRCNVTNAMVGADDFITSTPRLVRNLLRGFGPDDTRSWFEARGLALQVESLGKVFPVSGRAQDVVDTLMAAADAAGVQRRFETPVTAIEPIEGTDVGWTVDGRSARAVVIATGGRSVPATGSTGFGLDLAASIGHELAPSVPHLAPLFATAGVADLAGLSIPAIVTVTDDRGAETTSAAGSLLFTHRGVTGPAAFDVSGAVETLLAAGRQPQVTVDLWSLADPSGPFGPHLREPKLPGCCIRPTPAAALPSDVDRELREHGARRPGLTVLGLLQQRLPRRLAGQIRPSVNDARLGQLPKQDRRQLAEALTRFVLEVNDTGGWAKAEVTTGGVRLDELDRRTLASRRAEGLHFCGEVCDVTGRLGGFNFQWAWTSGRVAGVGAAARLPAG